MLMIRRMDKIRIQWSFAADRAQCVPAEPMRGSDEVPAGSSCSELASALDAARTRVNHIVSVWKDAVGPEQDSAAGRSNTASRDRVEGEMPGSDESDGEASDDESEDDDG